jgi:hypothetical protein
MPHSGNMANKKYDRDIIPGRIYLHFLFLDQDNGAKSRGLQTVGLVQIEIIICIRSFFFSLSNYEPNRTSKNMNRINRKLNKPKLYYLKGNKNIKNYKK